MANMATRATNGNTLRPPILTTFDVSMVKYFVGVPNAIMDRDSGLQHMIPRHMLTIFVMTVTNKMRDMVLPPKGPH